MKNICPICNRPCKRIYCSQACNAVSRSKRENRNCRNCGKDFTVKQPDIRKGYGIYCSVPCRRIYQAQHSKNYAQIGTVAAHRIIAAEMLGRELLPGEVVHHRDGNKRNNDPANLVVLKSHTDHMKIEIAEGRITFPHDRAVENGRLSGIARRLKSKTHQKDPSPV